MRIFLDSSFFFPLISIQVKNLSKKQLADLLKNSVHEILRSELVIFELSAKGTKLVNNGVLSLEDITDGLNTLVYQSNIQVIPIHYSEIQILATILRKDHSDFIDCLILASAINYADIFITMDEKIKKNTETIWKNIIKERNEDFKVTLWKDFVISEK
ncbi:MAG: PIN domain-containing protein [Candidatus Hodarchaeales archaeon]